MVDDFDRIVHYLQEALLEGYSEKYKNECLNPNNIGEPEHANSHVRITGPCGDIIDMWLAIEDGKISNIGFLTDGCGATITCASCVTRMAKGKSLEEAHCMKPEDVIDYFEGLPDEHKHCAKLAVMTLKAAIETYQGGTYEKHRGSPKTD